MIDKRLMDYSEGYRDYGDKLRDEGLELKLGDVLLIIEGFLMRYRGALTGDGGERSTAMPGNKLEDGGERKSSDFDEDSTVLLHLLQALKLGRAYNMQP